jgi:1-carboxybiuret hydrolase subunit AtzG-like protein
VIIATLALQEQGQHAYRERVQRNRAVRHLAAAETRATIDRNQRLSSSLTPSRMLGKPKSAPKSRTRPRRAAAGAHESIDTLIAASAQALRLPLDPAWHAAVRANLQLLLKHAALVEEFSLPDDTEPAPVFRA